MHFCKCSNWCMCPWCVWSIVQVMSDQSLCVLRMSKHFPLRTHALVSPLPHCYNRPFTFSPLPPRCVAHLLFPQSSQYPFRLGQQAEVAQYLLQIVPHLMHVAHKLPSTSSSSSFGDSTTVRWRETDVMSGTQPGQSGHMAFHSPVMAANHTAIHRGESASLSKKSEVSELPHCERDSEGGGLVRLATGSSKDASVGEGEGNIDNNIFRPPTTAEEKLEILKRLNTAISEHRKKVGVKCILDENSQSPSGDAPALPNAGEGEMG